jgi:hypothetical protein
MDIVKIQDALKKLLDEISKAQGKGYQYANAPLTEEVRQLIPKIKSGTLSNYVDLKFTAGPHRCFCETLPEDCKELENAWYGFTHVVQGLHEDPVVQEIINKMKRRGV